MGPHIDSTHLCQEWLPRVDNLVSSVSFAKNRYRVLRVYVCATILSQEEAEIRDLLATIPSFSVTQEKLDWQPEDDVSHGRVYQHLLAMGAAGASRPPVLDTLFENVESSVFPGEEPDYSERFYRQSFRLSSLEVFNVPGDTSLGYHIGATSFDKLTQLRDSDDSDENWVKWLFEYIVKYDVESPRIVWAQDNRVTAVLWQVQLDILDSSSPWRRSSSCSRSRRNPYGPFLQVSELPGVEDASENGSPEARVRCRGVRYRDDRKSWVAEMRLPSKFKKNKVSFGDFKSRDQAARAADAAFYYYGKQQFNFASSPQILLTQPLPVGLGEDGKLRFVKERAKWLATTIAPTPRLSSSTAAPLAVTAVSPPSSVTAEMTPDPTSSLGLTALPTISSESSFKSSYGNGDEGAVESTPLEESNMIMSEFSNDHHGQFMPENYMLQTFLMDDAIFPGRIIDYDLYELSANSSPAASPSFNSMEIETSLWN